ncbi:RIBC2 protein, partial [Pseudoatta argentina]
HRGHCEAVQDDEDKKAKIYDNHVTGDFLIWARKQAESRGSHKLLTNRYKGMTKLEEKNIKESWDLLMDSHLQAAYLHDHELNIKKSELNKKIVEKNLRLAEQQKQHQKYLNHFVYKHQLTADFYEQFNKGTR